MWSQAISPRLQNGYQFKDTLIFDEDFINDFPDKINSFIKIYCSPK